jgi:hypothetical protein
VRRLEEITAGNLDAAIAVSVRPDQEHAVDPVVKSLAEAYVHPRLAWPRLIRDEGRAVGFLMAFVDADFAQGGEKPISARGSGGSTSLPASRAAATAASRSSPWPQRSDAAAEPC